MTILNTTALKRKIAALERLARDSAAFPGEAAQAQRLAAKLRAQLGPQPAETIRPRVHTFATSDDAEFERALHAASRARSRRDWAAYDERQARQAGYEAWFREMLSRGREGTMATRRTRR